MRAKNKDVFDETLKQSRVNVQSMEMQWKRLSGRRSLQV